MVFKNVSRFMPGLLLCLGTVLMPSAFAACRPGGNTPPFPLIQRISGPAVIDNLNPALPIGTVLASVTINESTGFQVSCFPQKIFNWHLRAVGTNVGPGLVDSGIPGIGLRITRPDGRVLPVDVPLNHFRVNYNPEPHGLQLVKVGNITQGGTLSGSFYEILQTNPGNFLLATAQLTAPIRVELLRAPTCVVDTQNIDVSFPSIPLTPSINPVLARSDFAIRLNCSGGDPGATLAVNLALTDAITPGNVSEVLSLAPASTAMGVGIRVLFNSSPIRFGPYTGAKPLRVGATANGIYTIPLNAELFQTGTPKAGQFTASATFTIDHQ